MQNRASEQSYEDGREKSQRARVSYYRREEIKAEKTIITMRWVAGRYRNLKEQLDSELDNQEELQLLNVRIKRGTLFCIMYDMHTFNLRVVRLKPGEHASAVDMDPHQLRRLTRFPVSDGPSEGVCYLDSQAYLFIILNNLILDT
ncbi:hypothetical protein AVEN_134444-2 [Araneus ventricosus]|uniref:Uncharacterized protein n=1 Tax=Araneus ventricosus TaxID=182803 RepID=A0A4Y2K331_ARAVE|nr:hypothetical protein AVEN_134444-2 [Araneus ventricosus]